MTQEEVYNFLTKNNDGKFFSYKEIAKQLKIREKCVADAVRKMELFGEVEVKTVRNFNKNAHYYNVVRVK